MFDRYEWLISLHFSEEYDNNPAKCIDTHWKDISDIIENDRLRRAKHKCDYYESEGIDCDIESEYRIIKALDDHYTDLWL